MFKNYIILILLVNIVTTMPVWATNTYINTYKGKDIDEVKAELPSYIEAPAEREKSNVLYDVGGAFGGNTISSNFSIEALLAYKLTKNYHTGLSFYLYSYSETYSKSAPQTSTWVEPHSTAKLGSNSVVFAWYQEYQLTSKTKIFSQVGLPVGHNKNTYDTYAQEGYTYYPVTGDEYFNGKFTFDLGLKYYLSKSFYIGGQYRFFNAEIDTYEVLYSPEDSNTIIDNRTIKEGIYNNHSVLINIGYTFNVE